jgi:DNA-binding transcriptional LysR family regulator
MPVGDEPAATRASRQSAPGPATRDAVSQLAPLPQALRKLRLRDLETLDWLGRTRSFARTAEAAAITQPALSKWLRELELAIGMPLFERTTRRVAPTVYGEAVLEYIGRILTDLRGVTPALDALRQGLSMPLSIGLLPNMGAQLLPDLIEHLQMRGSPIQLNLREHTLDYLLPQAQRRELDLLVCRLDANVLAAGLAVEPLYRDDMVVVGGPHHPLGRSTHVDWQEAARFPWIAPPVGSPMRAALEAEFANAGLAMPTIVMESVAHSTNCAVAQRIPCLFVASARGLESTSNGMHALYRSPLRLSTITQTIGALYSTPCSAAAATVIEALKNIVQLNNVMAGH